MKYTIYFHGGCMDGVSSAAVLSYIIRARGDAVSNFVPVSYPPNPEIWKKKKFADHAVIADFLYHPSADIWFDHHPTTFLDDAWKRSFIPDALRRLDTASPSCTGLIVRHAGTRLDMRLPRRFSDLARWLDVFDAAKFRSPEESFRLRYPAEQIHAALSEDDSESFQRYLVTQLCEKSLSETARLPRVQHRFARYRERLRRSREELGRRLVIENGVAFIDISDQELVGSRFFAFLVDPQIRYVVRLVRRKNFELSVGSNPWKRPDGRIHIGNLLHKRYGGGGHQYVGGARFPTKERALQAAREIIEYLQKK